MLRCARLLWGVSSRDAHLLPAAAQVQLGDVSTSLSGSGMQSSVRPLPVEVVSL